MTDDQGSPTAGCVPTDTEPSAIQEDPISQKGPGYLDAIRALPDLIDELIQTIQDAWDTLVDHVNSFLQRVVDYLNNGTAGLARSAGEFLTNTLSTAISVIKQWLEKLRSGVDQVLTALRRVVQDGFPVVSLFTSAAEYADSVLPALSNISTDLRGSGKIDSWHGPTKDTYEKRVTEQDEAMSRIMDHISAACEWLGSVAAENANYAMELIKSTIGAITVMVALSTDIAATAAGDAPQAVAAMEHATETIGEICATILSFATELGKRLAKLAESDITFHTAQGNSSGLKDKGYSWPVPVET